MRFNWFIFVSFSKCILQPPIKLIIILSYYLNNICAAVFLILDNTFDVNKPDMSHNYLIKQTLVEYEIKYAYYVKKSESIISMSAWWVFQNSISFVRVVCILKKLLRMCGFHRFLKSSKREWLRLTQGPRKIPIFCRGLLVRLWKWRCWSIWKL